MNDWSACKNILCIRPDNMGDLIMSGPAIRALKETFGARITVLTSSMAAGIAKSMPEIDDIIVFDLPWVKTQEIEDTSAINQIVEELKLRKFDAAVIFTVYSQNPLPTAMLAYLAGIPKRLAYCRENPYQLLTDWVPDKEPYSFIRHQVKRDLDLIATINATTYNKHLLLNKNENLWPSIEEKLAGIGVDTSKQWIILHAGVSETKREYPINKWIEAGKKLIEEFDYQLIFTGSAKEKPLTDHLQSSIPFGSFSAGGLFSLDELILLISKSPLIISVNTGTIHIAAAVGTPVIVLYALTNPQHTPWGVPCKVLPFKVQDILQSKNEVIRFINNSLFNKPVEMPSATDILEASRELLKQASPEFKEVNLEFDVENLKINQL
ncbi:MAG: glycosyl transferase family 9 [Mucilaginibacter sp.]|jgi:lipopolysaccharide heptosyltransferase II|nr:glycosyl transferase family 9 [Mucilaginibacter sp.]